MPEVAGWGLSIPLTLAVALFGYLMGSVPYGLIITRLAGHGDIREIGSGNIGTTNVLRTGSKKLAALTLLGDALKGTAAVLLVGVLFGRNAALLAGFAAFLGHLYPVWLKFKGGKGVATYLGILLGLAWPVGLTFAVIWIATAALFRFSSLSALAASLSAPLLLLALGDTLTGSVFAVLCALLWAKHHENIGRLLSGQESKIGQRSSTAPPPEDPAPPVGQD
ncbi:glycerol-3-phosphate 1-O-acyltransferase PlsY [Roseibium limicola]|nr:glycerol-3-phosphate 1-O-acyltransferase PlsY [Roseibium limicola]